MNLGRSRHPSRALVVATIAFAAVGVIVALTLSRPTGPIDPETRALRVATEGALRSLHGTEPPGTYDGGPLPSPIAVAMRARVISDIGRYFTARLQARYQPMILDANDQIGASEWETDVDIRFDWPETIVAGDRATVHVIENGSLVRRGGPFGTDPTASHRLDWMQGWTVLLVRTAGEWRFDELDLQCGRGCG
jgi:hypothetical protein